MKRNPCCRWCKHAPEWQYGESGRILGQRGGPCRWSWDSISIPASIYFFNVNNTPPAPGYVLPSMHQNCPAFEWMEENDD